LARAVKRVVVVAGLIRGPVDGPNAHRYLISRRPSGTHLAHSWEFPGGKLELGESPHEGLRRELREELGIEVQVGAVFAVGQHVYGHKDVLLLVFDARLTAGAPQCLEVAEFRWVTAAELLEIPLPPADRPVVDRLRRERVGAASPS